MRRHGGSHTPVREEDRHALLAATVPRWRGSGQARERTTPALATDAG